MSDAANTFIIVDALADVVYFWRSGFVNNLKAISYVPSTCTRQTNTIIIKNSSFLCLSSLQHRNVPTKYIHSLSFVAEFRFTRYNPSIIACASITSALCGLNWVSKSGCSREDLLEKLAEITHIEKVNYTSSLFELFSVFG